MIGMGLLSNSGTVLASSQDDFLYYTGHCKEIYETLHSRNYESNLKECITNKEGQVTDL